jgi:hypothetical protein
VSPSQSLINDNEIRIQFLGKGHDFGLAAVQIRKQIGTTWILLRPDAQPRRPLQHCPAHSASTTSWHFGFH